MQPGAPGSRLARPARADAVPPTTAGRSHMSARAVVATVVLVLLGIGVGWSLHPTSQPPPPAAPGSPVSTALPRAQGQPPEPVTTAPGSPLSQTPARSGSPAGATDAQSRSANLPLAAAPSPALPAAQSPASQLPASPAPSLTAGAPAAAEPVFGSGEFSFLTATEAQILNHVPPAGAPDPTVFRFAPNPRILVLDFASLRDQGRMLNRVAALVEKSGLPHDRVLTTLQLAAAIRASGDTEETYYYGHDYDAASVIRFFALADRDNIRLLGEEDRLGRMIRAAGWLEPNARAALISIPQTGANANVTQAARATILHHELSHGEYFTDPVYAAFVHQFWTQSLAETEREAIRRHLRSVGYDPGLEEVMENEAQAYLMFTDGPEFFTPDMIGMSPERLAELRRQFYRTMPGGWLRDSLGRTLGVMPAAAERP